MQENSIVEQTPLQIFLRFLRFGCLAWGGPVAQIAMIKQELVEEEKWVSREHFNRALAVYQVLPGPEAHELCVWFGMRAGGRLGGFLAGLGFMLPGLLLMLCLIFLYVQFGIKSPLIQTLFLGVQAAVIALICFAVYRIGKHAVLNYKLAVIASTSFVFSLLGINFFILLAFAGGIYVFWEKTVYRMAIPLTILFLGICTCCLYLQGFKQPIATFTENPVAPNNTESPLETVFFTGLKGGLLTFGGAYTAIPFIRQDAVVEHHWMTQQQFLDGLALSGILPAPLVIFATFVGYFGGGWAGALLITLGMFLPAFGFTLIGHSAMERLISNKALHHFLDGVTAGVIGLIAATALLLFSSTVTTLFAWLIFGLSLAVLIKYKSKYAGIVVICGSAVLGAFLYFI